MFALGLHQEIKMSSEVPFWLVESRRKALGDAYAVDKMICTFVGRPPRISKRYCTIEAPLDIHVRDYDLEDEELRNKLSELDASGWRYKTPHVEMSYHTRSLLFSSLIREEILELSLGPYQENIYDIAA